MIEQYVLPDYMRGVRPIICCECGARPMRVVNGIEREEFGEYQARRAGWEGFSHLDHERLGTCPQCRGK